MAQSSSQNNSSWLVGDVLPWPKSVPVNKIDTHHHWVPTEYAKAVEEAGGDPSGWPTPSWSQQATEKLMDRVGAATAILSITAPGACILDGEASYKLARSLNDQAAAMRDGNPAKFGFFATLPSLLDTQASLKEIEYALDHLRADGVCLFTRYGDGNYYLGHPKIEPIWQELNRRKAVVFVHPTHPVDTNKVNDKLPQPLIDYPHETTRTAMDMMVAGTLRKYTDVKVILSHAGGNLPWIIGRMAEPMAISTPGLPNIRTGFTYDEFMKDFRSFYYDVALSCSPAALRTLYAQVPHDRILYGSDFPYAPPPAFPAFLNKLEEFPLTQDQRDKLNFSNAHNLFPRLKKQSV